MGTSCGRAAQLQAICRHKLEGQAPGRCGRATGPGQEAGPLPCTQESSSICLLGLVPSQETHHFVPVVGWGTATCSEWHKIGLLNPRSGLGPYHCSVTQLRASDCD